MKTNKIKICLCRQIGANGYSVKTDTNFGSNNNPYIQILQHKTNCFLVDNIHTIDASIKITVIKITMTIRRHTDKAIRIVNANRKGGNRCFFTIGKRNLFTTTQSKSHGGGKLYKTSQVNFDITHFNLNQGAFIIKNHRIIAASRYSIAISGQLAIFIEVFGKIKYCIVIKIFAGIKNAVIILILISEVKSFVPIFVFG